MRGWFAHFGRVVAMATWFRTAVDIMCIHMTPGEIQDPNRMLAGNPDKLIEFLLAWLTVGMAGIAGRTGWLTHASTPTHTMHTRTHARTRTDGCNAWLVCSLRPGGSHGQMVPNSCR